MVGKNFKKALNTRLSTFQKIYLLLIAGFILGPFIPLVIQSFAFRWAWPDMVAQHLVAGATRKIHDATGMGLCDFAL